MEEWKGGRFSTVLPLIVIPSEQKNTALRLAIINGFPFNPTYRLGRD
jgi:hypothetical protein